ncbi:MAG: RagB/SusD family nutrient uptake outer membrane protein [Bacteroidaceae bacterium]|nr:RagB/SusD family nutrient uptake outer membrane protein [Bacteroidaceae bacterium]
MKILKLFLLLLALLFVLSACEEVIDDGFKPTSYNVSGKVEKGPFVSGSEITIQPMDGQMQPLGVMYTSTIQDHLGNFSFGIKQFESPHAVLTANGYFFNEVTGFLSSGTLYLRAVVDLTKSETVNVNIITHIKYQRVLNLISQGKSYDESNKQAQEELFAEFGLQKYASKEASLYSISEGTDESAVLIAISSLILVDRSEAEMTEYLAQLCKEFADSGKFSDNTKEQIKSDREELKAQDRLSEISNNIQSRYNDLEIEIKVKELMYFFDWNNDGIAGNETLKEGENISIETDSLKIPYTGGNYTIKIESPVPVYLETPWLDITPPTSVIIPESLVNLYQFSTSADEGITLEKSIKDNVLTINVSELNSYRSKSAFIQLYDCMGTVLDTINIIQDANPNIAPPQCIGLTESGKSVFAGMALSLAKAFSNYNVIEQYYHFNKQFLANNDKPIGLVDYYVLPSNGNIASVWESFYKANSVNETMHYYDALSGTLYPQMYDVFSAIIYYYMVVGWGNVPYMIGNDFINNGIWNPSRDNQNDILDDLTEKLIIAISALEEKKNESLMDIDNLFFVSKDVARILLANIYMYRKQHGEALGLLQAVIESGFYSLDNSIYSNPATIDSLFNERTSSELIFAFDASSGTRTAKSESIEIRQALLVPIMTYTDVLLAYAECLYHAGNTSDAQSVLNQVVEAKGINVAAGFWEGITDARRQLLLYCNGNFAFYKRNDIAIEELAIEEFQLLFPIPEREINTNFNMTQNPGYDNFFDKN